MRPSDASAHGTISHEAGSWRGFTAAFGIAAGITLAVLYGIVLGLDPYGRRAGPGRPPSPIMDVNQRYMYPQVARSGRYDAAVFGTSTVRLLDPRALGAELGGRFANLALNAGTPWEQLELAKLFLRHVPAPSGIVLGLDRPWCDPTADTPAQRLTFRSFPPWLYDERSLGDLPHLLNMKSLEIAIRVALHRAGLMRERIRGDGYEVFTPPEASYDLARVRLQLYADPGPASTEPAGFESEPRRPALAWLAAFASSLPATTRLVLLFPPLHVSGQPAAGTPGALDDESCKRGAAQAVAAHGATIVDYRRPTGLTREDSNFWDRLHYRLPIAARIVADLAAAIETGRDAADGSYGVVVVPRS